MSHSRMRVSARSIVSTSMIRGAPVNLPVAVDVGEAGASSSISRPRLGQDRPLVAMPITRMLPARTSHQSLRLMWKQALRRRWRE
jgi:hypothetical protein